MIPVEQTILDVEHGNCFAACVASILELPIAELPNYRSEDFRWWHDWQVWLQKYNLAFLGWPSDSLGDDQVRADTLRGYSICTVRYGPTAHSCVALNGEVVWNPHPLRDTQTPDCIQDWIIFRVIDPSKPIMKVE